MLNLNCRVGAADLLLATFDALRYDVAAECHRAGRTPFLAGLAPQGWEERHSPGSFTYAAHAAIFAGFFPTPTRPGRHLRPFALRFHASRNQADAGCLLEGATIVEGLRRRNYHTICVGGVGFFNRLNPLGRVFPDLFDESHWSPRFGVGEPRSPRFQAECAVERIDAAPREQPLLLFWNLSALHPPTHFYVKGAKGDSLTTQAAALAAVDRELPAVFAALRRRGRGGAAFLMSDHGTAFGEDGYTGHRLAHPVVWTVPYAECDWEAEP